ncbi:hypothetical protein ACTXG6_09945 [Pseudonocardia sp. Cha107L01]|uniref:hypothetical protein n=1 Tax=Pseudonocardia sp. Cha107L01 TaxID=3457576 RepID=UPI00403EDE9D
MPHRRRLRPGHPGVLDAAGQPAHAVRRGGRRPTPTRSPWHGTADTIISPSQTLLLHTALRAAGVDSTRYLLAGANHGDLVFLGDVTAGLPWTTREVLDRAVAFLSSHLAGRSS